MTDVKTGSDFYEVTKLDDSRFRIYSPAGVFADLILGSEKALLIDTAYGFGDLKGTVRNITDLPLVIVNTHGHLDHACGNFRFEEEIRIHPLDMELCAEHCGHTWRMIGIEYARHCPAGENGAEIDLLPQDFDEKAYKGHGTGRLVPLEEGETIDLGGKHLRVIHLPGHTPGSIGLFLEETGTLYAGDAMNANFWIFLPEALKLEDYKATLRKAMKIPMKEMIISHDPAPQSPEVLKVYLETAEKLDYEKGIPYAAQLVPGVTARICVREGFSPEDLTAPGFSAIVINRDHL